MTARRRAGRRLAGGLGLFAVLFQAILFGWHHHDLVLAGHLPAPVVTSPTAPPQAADDEDGCEICQVLHHMTAAPVDMACARPPFSAVPLSEAGDEAFLARPPTLGFSARAPPLV
jgi:hypothetical protein